jgi:histidinol-phosphate aminotransferase
VKSQPPRIRALPRVTDLAPLPPSGLARRMGLNESPLPLPEPVRAAISAASLHAHRYPDHESAALAADLAALLRVPAAHIVVGAGLVELCRGITHMTASAGDEVVIPWPSFDDYLLDAGLFGARAVLVPLRADHIDVDATLAAVGGRTRLIFVCSPNNPTGTALSREDLERLINLAPADAVIVLDEAYAEFADRAPGVRLHTGHPNLCVLRTFSKAYGLAGLRVGYAVTQPPLAGPLREYLAPFGVSNIAQAAARAVLAHHELYADRIAFVIAERRRLTTAIRALGWPVADSQANFVWLRAGADAEVLAGELAGAGISVRCYPGAGLRITIGTPEENDCLLASLARDPRRSPPAATVTAAATAPAAGCRDD